MNSKADNLQPLDFARPNYMDLACAKSFVPIYLALMRARAEGKNPDPVKTETAPESMQIGSQDRIPTGEFTRWGSPLYYDWRWRDGVATIDFIGSVSRYDSWLSWFIDMAVTEVFAQQIAQAHAHPAVSAVVLNIDSGGGDSRAIPELGDFIYSLRGQGKPIVAYIDGTGASAGYWPAAAADEIVIAQNALVGSIGAVYIFEDDTEAMAKQGYKEIVYRSSQTPLKWAKPGTKAGDDQYQRLVDDSAQIFAEAVARYRAVSIETVWEEFGQGGVLTGQRAVDAGSADRIGTYESLVDELAHGYKPKARKQRTGANGAEGASMKFSVSDPKLVAGLQMLGIIGEVEGTAAATPAATAPVAPPAAEPAAPAAVVPAAVVPTPAAPAAADPRDAEIERLKQQLAQAQNGTQQQAVASRTAQIDAFAASLSGKVPAASVDSIKAVYASLLDTSPDQAEVLKATYEATPVNAAFAPVPTPPTPGATTPVEKPAEATGAAVDPLIKEKALAAAGVGKGATPGLGGPSGHFVAGGAR
jgi:ClpP class serine protease